MTIQAHSPLVVALVLFGCGAKDRPDTADATADADSGSDSGSDSATDSGSDETDTDTGVPVDCTVTGLSWTAQIRNFTGDSGTTWTTGPAFFLYAIVENPCTNTVEFTTSSCLATGWQMSDEADNRWGRLLDCTEESVQRSVEPGGRIDQHVADLGTLDPQVYTVGVRFDVADPDSPTGEAFVGSVTFEVLAE